MAGPTIAPSGFAPINKASPGHPPPKLSPLQPQHAPAHFAQAPPHNQQQFLPQFPHPYQHVSISGEPMQLDNDNDSNATVIEREDGHFDYHPLPETINLTPYQSSLVYLLSPPRGIPYETSVEIATLIMDTHLRVLPLYPQNGSRPELAAFAFMERLFNFGRIAGKDGRTRFTIENASRTRIVLADTKIHILGTFSSIKIARDAVCSLILGAPCTSDTSSA